MILLGVEDGDAASDLQWLSQKILKMRIFPDAEGKMNLSIQDVGGEVLVVSQFTLLASTKKGNRPSFIRAGRPELSEPMYEAFCEALQAELTPAVQRGRFGADMKVHLVNDGPVTIVIDSRNPE